MSLSRCLNPSKIDKFLLNSQSFLKLGGPSLPRGAAPSSPCILGDARPNLCFLGALPNRRILGLRLLTCATASLLGHFLFISLRFIGNLPMNPQRMKSTTKDRSHCNTVGGAASRGQRFGGAAPVVQRFQGGYSMSQAFQGNRNF